MNYKLRVAGLLALIIILALACSFPNYLQEVAVDEDLPELPTPASFPTLEESVDCAEDLDCFLEKVKDCKKDARFLFVSEINFFGAISKSEIQFLIEGEAEGGCALALTTESVSLVYADEMVEQMKEGGLTEDQIEEQRQMGLEGLEAGKYDDRCVGAPADFAILLQNWQSGLYTLNDFDSLSCSGKIFSNMSTVIEVTVEVVIPVPDLPDGYFEQEAYGEDCLGRPENTTCLRFRDGYIWLIPEPYIEERDENTGEWEGHVIELVVAPKNLYYHILGTNYIKEVSGIEGYTEQESYQGDCTERPMGTVCLGFQDGYIWLVSDVVNEWVHAGSWDGHAIYYAKAEKADYYHVLDTNYIKRVPHE